MIRWASLLAAAALLASAVALPHDHSSADLVAGSLAHDSVATTLEVIDRKSVASEMELTERAVFGDHYAAEFNGIESLSGLILFTLKFGIRIDLTTEAIEISQLDAAVSVTGSTTQNVHKGPPDVRRNEVESCWTFSSGGCAPSICVYYRRGSPTIDYFHARSFECAGTSIVLNRLKLNDDFLDEPPFPPNDHA
ncbi:uncharacterized protein L969DRAFT_17644 [Mixia osmundae IAM 14324]|uniref:Uncharacterized protein n=1 Tax=Mixia osmundae (strain CBS 9802 / IAM 14324 / JCM 22182 / KY 12970) TaxID=764103 RepID=G7E479_MIXOS|nr:uncharacterized protein L969DRAFT_17644 [Mixia osmundae IAM 14324]KEI39735.1 hypothetical protein L969DRAFT_17644 [Mixia osmundae IAM 14324]GAA97639.1 hypothetical protein E5Q_04317 [Mixia osmundae IAM 14324]